MSVFRALRRHPVTDRDVVGGVALPDVGDGAVLVGFALVHAGPGGVVGVPFPPGIASRAVVRVGDSTPRPFSWRRLMAHAPEGETVCGVLGVEEVRVRQPGALGARRHKPAAAGVVSFSCPLGSQCCGCASLRTPGPLRSTRSNARSAGTALLCTRRPSALPAGQGKGWTGLMQGGGRWWFCGVVVRSLREGRTIMGVGDTLCGVRETVSGWVATILPAPAQVARGGRAARTADFRVRHRNTEMRGMT